MQVKVEIHHAYDVYMYVYLQNTQIELLRTLFFIFLINFLFYIYMHVYLDSFDSHLYFLYFSLLLIFLRVCRIIGYIDILYVYSRIHNILCTQFSFFHQIFSFILLNQPIKQINLQRNKIKNVYSMYICIQHVTHYYSSLNLLFLPVNQSQSGSNTYYIIQYTYVYVIEKIRK